MEYGGIYANLWRAGGSFTAADFRAGAAGPNPDKVLHDLVALGYLEKTGRGLYTVRTPDEVVGRRASEYGAEADWLLDNAKLGFAFCSSDAVGIWTNGGYNTGGTRFLAPINIAVRRGDLTKWKGFFAKSKKSFIVFGEPAGETIVGPVFVLHPWKRLGMAKKDGIPVITLGETVKLCRGNPFVYEPALEMLENLYGIKTGVKYDTYA